MYDTLMFDRMFLEDIDRLISVFDVIADGSVFTNANLY